MIWIYQSQHRCFINVFKIHFRFNSLWEWKEHFPANLNQRNKLKLNVIDCTWTVTVFPYVVIVWKHVIRTLLNHRFVCVFSIISSKSRWVELCTEYKIFFVFCILWVLKQLQKNRYNHVFNNLSQKFSTFLQLIQKKLQCLTIEFLFLDDSTQILIGFECAREWGISITPSIIFIVVGGVGSHLNPPLSSPIIQYDHLHLKRRTKQTILNNGHP